MEILHPYPRWEKINLAAMSLTVDRTAIRALRAVSARFQAMDGPQTRSLWPVCFPSRAGLMSAPHPVRRAWRCPSRLPPLVDLPQKHWDTQPFARGLAWQKLALSLRQMPTLTVMLRT